MKGKVELHPLVLLFALVGGTRVFGLLGLFAGPVILGVTFALLDMVEFDLQNAGFLDEHPADDAAREGRGEDLRLSPGRHAPS
jgi:predicted PurR-regulated permease PerM